MQQVDFSANDENMILIREDVSSLNLHTLKKHILVPKNSIEPPAIIRILDMNTKLEPNMLVVSNKTISFFLYTENMLSCFNFHRLQDENSQPVCAIYISRKYTTENINYYEFGFCCIGYKSGRLVCYKTKWNNSEVSCQSSGISLDSSYQLFEEPFLQIEYSEENSLLLCLSKTGIINICLVDSTVYPCQRFKVDMAYSFIPSILIQKNFMLFKSSENNVLLFLVSQMIQVDLIQSSDTIIDYICEQKKIDEINLFIAACSFVEMFYLNFIVVNGKYKRISLVRRKINFIGSNIQRLVISSKVSNYLLVLLVDSSEQNLVSVDYNEMKIIKKRRTNLTSIKKLVCMNDLLLLVCEGSFFVTSF
eukprot:snap_masked-scaffold_46-processed-gene-1.3-mRNA-1 protein AED:1.00 eAED:1.00 QI:0/0/0/0/1/1/3/0/362